MAVPIETRIWRGIKKLWKRQAKKRAAARKAAARSAERRSRERARHAAATRPRLVSTGGRPVTRPAGATGAFLSVKVGGTWLIDPQSVRTWLESRTIRPSARTT